MVVRRRDLGTNPVAAAFRSSIGSQLKVGQCSGARYSYLGKGRYGTRQVLPKNLFEVRPPDLFKYLKLAQSSLRARLLPVAGLRLQALNGRDKGSATRQAPSIIAARATKQKHSQWPLKPPAR